MLGSFVTFLAVIMLGWFAFFLFQYLALGCSKFTKGFFFSVARPRVTQLSSILKLLYRFSDF